MKTICEILCYWLIFVAILTMIIVLWYATEMALYGTSQQSIIDTFASVYISMNLSSKLISVVLGGKE